MKNLKCSFVIPGYKCDEFIFRNIDSILDQDYRNYEIIVVLNGDWDTRMDLYQKIKETYPDKIQLHWLPDGHLGRANNFGITKATGDITSHLSSDLYLLPGTLRTWVEAFNEHPECGFVYSGYKLVSPNPIDVYYSDPFDRYHLECENYIDGANPYRKEIVVKWSEDLKSLIDWDWALSLTDFGAKGWYIKEPLYYAELPKEGGLSYDSNMNWIKRTKMIKDRHNIPDRKMCIASIIDMKYALELAKLIDADYRNYPGHKPHEYDLIYQYGFPADLDRIQISVGVFYQHWKHKVIHWIGPDIITMMNLQWKHVDHFVQNGLINIQNHFCINRREQDVLKRMHIDSEIIMPPFKFELKKESVEAISVSDEELMHQLKLAMPDLEFRLNDLNCNITVHFQDTMSNVLKSICSGNYVICEKYMPSTYYIQAWQNIPELRKMITHTIRQIMRAKPEINQDDINSYRNATNPAYFKKKLEKIMEKKINKYAKLDDIMSGAKGVYGEA